MSRSPDIGPGEFPALDWDHDDLARSLTAVYEWVHSEVVRASAWYLEEKRSKARWSRLLRIVAVGLATAGAALPFVAAGSSDVGLEWGYALFAIAAGYWRSTVSSASRARGCDIWPPS